MPFVDINSDVSLWYRVSTPSGTLDDLCPYKPLLCLMHPDFLSVEFLDPFFHHDWLEETFTMIAFDQRGNGKTISPIASSTDYWVLAADLAFAQAQLKLPAFHIFATQQCSNQIALRFSLLFPTNVLSMVLSALGDFQDVPWARGAAIALRPAWLEASTLEEVEEINYELSILSSTYIMKDIDLLDRIIAHYQTRYPPNNCADFQQLWCLRETRYQIAPRALAFVTSPCLIIQPDSSLIHSHNLAETLQSELVNANCEVHIVEEAPDGLAFIEPYCTETIDYLSFFLERQLSKPELMDEPPPLTSPQTALARLSFIKDNPSIALRYPEPRSFSTQTAVDQKRHVVLMDQVFTRQKTAFSPLDAHGKPLRPFHERERSAMQFRHLNFSSISLSTTTSVSFETRSGTDDSMLNDDFLALSLKSEAYRAEPDDIKMDEMMLQAK